MKLSRLMTALIAPTIIALGAIASSEPAMNGCRVRIKGYHDATAWADGNIRILVEAASACGSRPGGLLDLENVRLTIESGSEKIVQLQSSTGMISQDQGKFVMGETFGPLPPGSPIPLVSALLVDFNAQVLRSPQGVYFKLKAHPNLTQGFLKE